MNLQIICVVCDKPVVITHQEYNREKRSIFFQVECHGKVDIIQVTDSEAAEFPADFTMTKKAFINELRKYFS